MYIITSFEILAQIINEEWNSLKITFAEPWTVSWTVPPGERDDYEIHLVEKGEGRFRIGKREFHVKPGDIIFLHSMEGNSFKPDEESFRFVFVTFKFDDSIGSSIMKKLNETLGEEALPFSIGDIPEIQQLFYRMHREISLKAEGYMFRLKLLLGMLVVMITDLRKKGDNKEDIQLTVNMGTRELVDKVILLLQRNYSRSIRLDDLGRQVNLHPRYLCTLFRQITGQTVTEYLRDLRIEKAKRLLLYTSLTITEIALDVGFSSSQYFSRVFSRAEGIDPRTFRKMRSGIHGICHMEC